MHTSYLHKATVCVEFYDENPHGYPETSLLLNKLITEDPAITHVQVSSLEISVTVLED